MQVWSVPFDSLKLGENPRKELGDIDGLARRILSSQWVSPFVVRESADGDYMIADGQRRWHAIQRARELAEEQPGRWSVGHLEQVPCQVIEYDGDKSQDRSMVLAFVANCERLELEYLDRIEWFSSLWDRDYTYSDISDMTGTPQSTVRQSVQIARKLAPAVKKALRTGDRIPQRTLLEWSRLPTTEQESELKLWQTKRTPQARSRRREKRRPRKELLQIAARKLRDAGHPVASEVAEWAAGSRPRPPKAAR